MHYLDVPIIHRLRRGGVLKISTRAIVLLALLTGCASSRTLTMVSTNDVEVGYPPARQRVTGRDCVYNFLGIPASDFDNPSVHRAIDSAVSQAPGSYAMSDMTVSRERLIMLAYNQACLKVEGNPVAQTTGSRYLDGIRREFDWSD